MLGKCKGKKGKKYIVLALVVMMLFAAQSAFALYDAPNKLVHMYVCTNSAAGSAGTTNISTSTIMPSYHRILGYRIAPYNTSKGSEFWCSLYDDTGTTDYTLVFDEAEWGATSDKSPIWYAYPKKLSTGLSVQQGANTVVIIYYEDIREF